VSTIDDLKREVAAADAVIKGWKMPSGEAPPRPARQTEGYRPWEASQLDLTIAQRAWDQTWLPPNQVAAAMRRKSEAEVRLAEAEEAAAQEQERRETARAALERQVQAAFMSNPAATDRDWERAKERLIADALTGETLIDQLKDEKRKSGEYSWA
jgi:hypothetical protein